MLNSNGQSSDCPINLLLDVVSPKWTVEILREMAIQPTRTRKFLLHIPGLSMKTLCRRLQTLESAGLILRHEYPGKAMKVEYSLSEPGIKLCSILEQLKQLEEELNSDCLKCKCSLQSACLSRELDSNCPHRRVRNSGKESG